eukprot:c23342_g1_i1 orf=384-1202(-)
MVVLRGLIRLSSWPAPRLPCRSGAPTDAFNLRKHALIFRKHPSFGSCTSSISSLHMNAAATDMTGTTHVVDHVVLFKVKDKVPSEQAEKMVNALRGLKSLDGVIQLTAGPSLQMQPGNYTHALYSRHSDKEALSTYASHPNHLDVVHKFVFPITEDILALDWEANSKELPLDVGAVSILLLKLKENMLDEDVSNVLEVLKDYRNHFPGIKQVSIGKNFSPARAKGFQWGFVALFSSPKEMEELTKNEQHIKLQNSKVLPILENYARVDYATN